MSRVIIWPVFPSSWISDMKRKYGVQNAILTDRTHGQRHEERKKYILYMYVNESKVDKMLTIPNRILLGMDLFLFYLNH